MITILIQNTLFDDTIVKIFFCFKEKDTFLLS